MEKENSMDNEKQSEYRAHVRGTATFILLGQKNPPMDAAELVQALPAQPGDRERRH